ncbi:lipopolysaccharide transport system permease protein [Bradyrhizobium sp. USDA 4504]
MLMFLGLILFGIVAEPLNRAPGLVLENVAYVKKVVFPLEILPVVALLSALFTAAISFIIFLVVYLFLYGVPPATILLVPFALLPLLLMTTGAVYFLSSLGVFLRDARHVLPLLTTALLFLSSVFTPPDAVPEKFRLLFSLNPVTLSVNNARDLAFWGRLPDPIEWFLYFLLSILVCAVGAYWFARTKKGFADVV